MPGSALGKGLPIGDLTSQYFVNLYLGELDHFLKERHFAAVRCDTSGSSRLCISGFRFSSSLSWNA